MPQKVFLPVHTSILLTLLVSLGLTGGGIALGEIIWDGATDTGRLSASGVYFFEMNIDGRTYRAKGTLLR